MVLTTERAEKLADYLKEDVERANNILELSPEEVVKIINEAGNDFSVEEITEFGENLKAVAIQADQAGELNEENLDKVSGGIAAAVASVYVACLALGVKLGIEAGKRWTW